MKDFTKKTKKALLAANIDKPSVCPSSNTQRLFQTILGSSVSDIFRAMILRPSPPISELSESTYSRGSDPGILPGRVWDSHTSEANEI
jgi:hypothetical protein